MSGKPQRKGNRGGGRGGGHQAPAQRPSQPENLDISSLSISSPTGQVTSEQVTAKEDAIIQSLVNVERTAVRLPSRPAYGTQGEKVEIKANYFPLRLPTDLILHCYSIKIEPIPRKDGKQLLEPQNKRFRRRLIQLLLGSSAFKDSNSSSGALFATDFIDTLISSKPVLQETRSLQIKYFHEADQGPSADAPEYKMLLGETENYALGDLISFMSSVEATVQYPQRLAMIQALNTLLGHHAKASNSNVVIGGKKVFSSKALFDNLGSGLAALQGFYLSVRLATMRILVNVNPSYGAFYLDRGDKGQAFTLATLMDSHGLKVLPDLNSFIADLRVNINHLRDANGRPATKVKTICGLAAPGQGRDQPHPPRVAKLGSGPRDVSFFLRSDSTSTTLPGISKGKTGEKAKPGKSTKENDNPEGRYITVSDFFSQHYHRRPDDRWPVVNVGSKRLPTYLPADYCFVQPGQLARCKLNPSQSEKMIRFAVRRPAVTVDSIVNNGLNMLGLSAMEHLRKFGAQAGTDMITVPGRLLPCPQIVYKGNKLAGNKDGGWNMIGVNFQNVAPALKNQPLQKWAFIVLQGDNGYDQPIQSTDSFVKIQRQFESVLGSTGLAVRQAKYNMLTFKSPPGDFYTKSNKSIEETFDIFRNTENTEFFIVVLPKKDIPLYNRIKRLGDVQHGVHTVCVVGSPKKFYQMIPADNRPTNNAKQYYANVALKINLKLGGTNHVLKQSLPIISEDKTMIVGIDVTHPPPGSASASIAAMVASMDKHLAQWPVVLRIQVRSRQEMVSQVGEMLLTRLELWKQRHRNTYPENILIYRDGVSEGQYEQVLTEELQVMQGACTDIYKKAKQSAPKFSLIVVGKRHHTRFFPLREGEGCSDRNGNPKNGLIVDRGVTEARNWDFFLQSHKAIQGTARPAHYYVLWDEIFTSPKHMTRQNAPNAVANLEQLTFWMCYLFSRSTMAVSICPAVYYADIACERARCYLSNVAPEHLTIDPDFGDMTGAAREQEEKSRRVTLQRDLQPRIQVHQNLVNTMFYV